MNDNHAQTSTDVVQSSMGLIIACYAFVLMTVIGGVFCLIYFYEKVCIHKFRVWLGNAFSNNRN